MGFHCSGTGWNFFELLRLGIIIIASIYLVAAGHFGWTIFLNVLLAIHQKSPDSSKDLYFWLSTSQKEAAVVAQWLSCSGISNIDFIGCKWDLSAVQIFVWVHLWPLLPFESWRVTPGDIHHWSIHPSSVLNTLTPVVWELWLSKKKAFKPFKKPLDFASINSYLAVLSLNLLHHAALNESF